MTTHKTDTTTYETLVVTQRGPVLEVELNRPHRRNAMTFEMFAEWKDILDKAANDPAIRVVTVTGRGPVFSAGHDIKDVAKDFVTSGELTDKPPEMRATLNIPEIEPAWFFRKPIVAGVHGYVGPQSNHFLSPIDFIIAAKGTRFSFEQVRLGGVRAGKTILAYQIPMRALKKLYMLGGWFDAETALEWQFVQRVVEEEEVRAEVARWADQLAMIPSQQIASAKEGIHRTYELMGLANMFFVGNHNSGHAPGIDHEFFNVVEAKGLKEALRMRQEGIDSTISKI